MLVAPDRLGVLHDVGATHRAAASAGVVVDAVVLMAPAKADASTGSNAAELALLTAQPILALPRAGVDELGQREDFTTFYAELCT